MKFNKRIAALLLLAGGAAAALIGAPDMEKKLAWASETLSAEIASREYHIDPAELLDLMYNNQARLALLDIRAEGDFNLFHLINARHFVFSETDLSWLDDLPEQTIHVTISNDEQAAEEAWKRLRVMGYRNIYVLTGGMNLWLDLCKPEHADADRMPAHVLRPDASSLGDEELHYTFPAALGDLYPEARPKAGCFSHRAYTPKVKALKAAQLPSGGCGG